MDVIMNYDSLSGKDAEMAFLGALLMGGEESFYSISETFHPEFFYYDKHKEVFLSISEIVFSGDGKVDIVTISQRLRDNNTNIQIVYLTELLNSVPTATNIKYYANIIIEKYKLRQLQKAIMKCVGLFQTTGIVSIASNEIEKVMMGVLLDNQNRKKQSHYVEEIIHEVKNGIDKYLDKLDMSVLPTGFQDIDNLIGGWQPGLITMAGEEGVGKTTLALNFAYQLLKQGHRGMVFSFESSKEYVLTRLACMESRVNLADYTCRKLLPEGRKRLKQGMDIVGGMPLVVNDNAECNIFDIITKTKQEKLKRGVDFLVVDYLQRIHPIDMADIKTNTEQRTTRDVMQLRTLARTLNIPVFCITSLNKDGSSRYSRAIDYEADTRTVLTRKKDAEGLFIDELQFKITKSKTGNAGSMSMLYYKAGNRYEEYYS